MADNFDVNQYKKENNNLFLTPLQKSLIISKMYQTDDMKKEKATRKYIWSKGIAALVAIALIVGIGFVGFGKEETENWFMLSVSAASTDDEAQHSSTDDETVRKEAAIGGYSESAMTGFFMESENGTLTKDGFKDYFAYYHMEGLSINGANIKSIEFASSKKGIYFVLNPTDNSADYLSDTAYIDSALTEYDKRGSLNNSQYSFDELREYAPYLLWPCDSFRYNIDTASTDEEGNLLPTNLIDIVLESDHSDPQVMPWVKEIGNIETKNDIDSFKHYAELEEKIQQKMLDDAELTVTVTYADNSTETQEIDLVYAGNRSLSFDIKK